MTIRLHNSRTRQKEAFEPLDPSDVRMYVCGPTVYDRAHIGNARPVVVFDVLYRLLRHEFGADNVTYVRNITDVDDKIIARAQETLRAGETLEAACRRITDETIGWYHDDMAALGALRPTHEPRCTEYIPQMVGMIEALVGRGFAYTVQAQIGHNSRSLYVMMDAEKVPEHALFEVGKYGKYGQLSGRSVDDMTAGARVEVAPYKRSPMDFVLWKPSTLEQPGWRSPWGRGRPGWHIECSAMAAALLGKVFDIHGGGLDLKFPHHENELAQSCCAHGTKQMAHFWMHNELLRVEGEKMAKSFGNFFTVRDLLDQGIPGEVLRFVLLSAHYRQPLDWTDRRVEEARSVLRGFIGAVKGADPAEPDGGVIDALLDDLNAPLAITRLHALKDDGKGAELLASARLMGSLSFAPTVGTIGWGPFSEAQSELLIQVARRWATLRERRNFAAADELRASATKAGVELRATKQAVGQGAEAEVISKLDEDSLRELLQ